jgi:transcriptional regulator with XRE-family HTH domain
MDEKINRIVTTIEYGETFDQITQLDINDNGFFNRLDALIQILIEYGQFTKEEANTYVSGIEPWDQSVGQKKYTYEVVDSTIQKVAVWARSELKKLRELEKQKRENKITQSPVLELKSISRSQLSDIAFQGLSSCSHQPNEELLMLIAELLDVDRHRKKNAEKHSDSFSIAAQLLAQHPEISNSKIAESLQINKSTVGRWRAMPEFCDKIESYKKVLSGLINKDLHKPT